MQRKDLKFLLIQLRHDEAMLKHEFDCMVRSGRINPDQITVVNILKDPLTMEHTEGVYAILIGASGDFSVFDDLPSKNILTEMIKKAKEKDIPILGSCWGAQFIAYILGGEVITDKENEEVGSYLITITEEAKNDPLFKDLPETFWGQIGHHQRVNRLPEGAVCLASSELCSIQAFTFPGKPIYGFQVHPELSKKDLVDRLAHYKASYTSKPGEFERIVEASKDSPVTEKLVGDFIDKIVLPRYS